MWRLRKCVKKKRLFVHTLNLTHIYTQTHTHWWLIEKPKLRIWLNGHMWGAACNVIKSLKPCIFRFPFKDHPNHKPLSHPIDKINRWTLLLMIHWNDCDNSWTAELFSVWLIWYRNVNHVIETVVFWFGWSCVLCVCLIDFLN